MKQNQMYQVSPGEAMSGIVILAMGGVFVYLIPFWIAVLRNHSAKWRILIVNIFVGWSGFGWIACLFWAVSSTDSESYRYNRRHD